MDLVSLWRFYHLILKYDNWRICCTNMLHNLRGALKFKNVLFVIDISKWMYVLGQGCWWVKVKIWKGLVLQDEGFNEAIKVEQCIQIVDVNLPWHYNNCMVQTHPNCGPEFTLAATIIIGYDALFKLLRLWAILLCYIERYTIFNLECNTYILSGTV